MKKFKNDLYIEGSQSLLKAFAEEIEKLGWEYKNTMTSNCNPKSFSKGINTLFCKKNEGYYGQNYWTFENYSFLHLPQDWNKAIALASEVVEEIPEYVKCTNWLGDLYTNGKIYKVADGIIIHDSGKSHRNISYYGFTSKFIPSTLKEYDAQQLEIKKKELLDEANRRYPVGTKFYSSLCGNYVYTVESNDYYWYHNNQIVVNTTTGPSIYTRGKWAEIIKEEFKVGDWVKQDAWDTCYKLKSINYSTGNLILDNPAGDTIGTYPIKLFRLATPEEIAKVKDTIEIAGYKAEFYHEEGAFGSEKLVKFGCKSGITQSDVYAIETVQQLCNHLNLSIQFSKDRLVVNGNSVDSETISKLIDKLG